MRTEEEQAAGFYTMIEEHLALPFPVKILGVDAFTPVMRELPVELEHLTANTPP